MTTPSRRLRAFARSRIVGVAIVATGTALALAGCSMIGGPGTTTAGDTPATPSAGATATTSPTPTPSPKPTPTGWIVIKAGDSVENAAKIDITTPITVAASKSTLTSVKVTGSNDTTVAGAYNADHTVWTTGSGAVLSPSTTYTVKAAGKGTDGLKTTKTTTYTTKTMAVIGSDITPEDGETVGIGMPIIVRFSAPITNKADVEKNLVVTSSSKVAGSWNWFSASEVHYRTQRYWPAGTNVTLKMNLKGVVGSKSGVFITDKVKTFHVGTAHLSKVDLKTHTLKYYVNGKLARTIPITGGKKGWETRSGVKLVLERRTDINMRSASVGVSDKDSADYYDLEIKYGLRVTWTGEFLHSAPWSIAAQGHANTSHGCVGMSEANTYYIWKDAMRGDPVETTGSTKYMPVAGNGWGDWNMSWSAWQAGSAL